MTHARAQLPDRVGLCRTCRFGERVPSSRGAEFWMCRRSELEPASMAGPPEAPPAAPRFPKYPRLPMVDCLGYERT
jgi:hypothetical protein